jgi:AbrB family looped-hinge helix DNA binding protein
MFSGNVDNCFWTHIGLRGDRLVPRSTGLRPQLTQLVRNGDAAEPRDRLVLKSGSSTTGGKGQITVPVEIRRRLRLKRGDRVEFIVDHGRATIRPPRAPENPG